MNRLLIIFAWVKHLVAPYRRAITTRRTPQIDITWVRFPGSRMLWQLVIRKRYGDGSTACVILTEKEVEYLNLALQPHAEANHHLSALSTDRKEHVHAS
jgi:hypothetical protein